MKIFISCSGMNSHARNESSETENAVSSVMLKMSRIVSLSPFPKYCAPKMDAAFVIAKRIIFWTNWIWVASETAVIST